MSQESPTPSRYQWAYQYVDQNGDARSVTFDFYTLLEIIGITHHAQAHAVKKIIRAGQSVKSKVTDIREAIDCLRRWEEMELENAKLADVYVQPEMICDLCGDPKLHGHDCGWIPWCGGECPESASVVKFRGGDESRIKYGDIGILRWSHTASSLDIIAYKP